MLDDRTVVRAETEGRVALVWRVPSNRFMWTSVGEADLIHDEGADYARRLGEAEGARTAVL